MHVRARWLHRRVKGLCLCVRAYLPLDPLWRGVVQRGRGCSVPMSNWPRSEGGEPALLHRLHWRCAGLLLAFEHVGATDGAQHVDD
jgi:hypothetical protein